MAEGRTDPALHLTEWAVAAAPDAADAQALERDACAQALAAAPNVMTQGVYRGAMNEARAALGEELLFREGRPVI